jgi:small-conductance mechanosensitive channel
MLKPIQEKTLKTVNEFYESNYKIGRWAFTNFMDLENPQHQKMIRENRVEKTYCSLREKIHRQLDALIVTLPL